MLDSCAHIGITMNRNRKTETLVYVCLWLIAAAVYLIDEMRTRASASIPLLEVAVFVRMVRVMLPFFILFVVNNQLLIPRLLLKNRYVAYFMSCSAMLLILWAFQYFVFSQHMAFMPPDVHPGHGPFPEMHPWLPLPLLLDFTYGILVLGVNLAVALIFQRFDDKLERESLMKANAQNELSYLKAQINPHFYMNMLNNIHGMIEIDPDRAQEMVIDMSNLMRYMLYDSSRPSISVSSEIAFLNNYINLLRLRFPADKVTITTSFPPEEKMVGVTLPPLLFLVFIENAFKHGVSYREKSYVAVSIEISNAKLHFTCINSVHPQNVSSKSHGIGLKNISQRLALIYGAEAHLTINQTDQNHTVNLTIPLHETKNADN